VPAIEDEDGEVGAMDIAVACERGVMGEPVVSTGERARIRIVAAGLAGREPGRVGVELVGIAMRDGVPRTGVPKRLELDRAGPDAKEKPLAAEKFCELATVGVDGIRLKEEELASDCSAAVTNRGMRGDPAVVAAGECEVRRGVEPRSRRGDVGVCAPLGR